jgi:hypothetical protein
MSYLIFNFVGHSASGKTKVWSVNYPTLGTVQWYAPWRRYVVYPASGTLFDANCLREIAIFCDTQTQEHKNEKA